MADLTLSAGTTLITDLFESIQYPWRARIDGDRMRAGQPEIELEVLGPGGSGEISADEPEFITEWVEAYLEADPQQRRQDGGEALDELIAPYTTGATDAQTVIQRLKAAPDFERRLQTFLNRLGLKFSVDWIEVELSSRPNASLGNPISINQLKLGARVKAKACIKIFHEEKCISITSPWVRFEDETARVQLQSSGLIVRALASVSNFDLVLKFKILGKTFEVRIGLTKYVNRYLAAQQPVLIDASNIEVAVPGLDRKYKPASVNVPAHPSTTSVVIEGGFSA